MKWEIKDDGLQPNEFPVPLWPIANYGAMDVIGLVIILIGVAPATHPALVVGAILVLVLIVCYRLFVRGQGRIRKELVDETSPNTVASIDTPGSRATEEPEGQPIRKQPGPCDYGAALQGQLPILGRVRAGKRHHRSWPAKAPAS